MTHLSMYMGGKFGILRKDGGEFWKVVIVLFPYGAAIIVAISTTMDYHNNFVDVVGGMIIGIFVGMLTYFLNYPSLFSKNCHLPKSRNYGSQKREAERYLEEESLGMLSVQAEV
jgi:diacylglycerol diphosphate phosphatase / phosphatidate phosphatase